MKNSHICRVGLIAISLALCQAPLFPSEIQAKRILIEADQGWQDTGIQLQKGQYYEIKARGSWVSGYSPTLRGPEGLGAGTICCDALVGFVSKDQPPTLNYESYKKEIVEKIILLSQGGLFKSMWEGHLWLGMGEWSGCGQCTGNIEVLITIYD